MLKRQTSWTRRDSSSASRSSSSKRIQSERRRTSNRRKNDLTKDSREDAEETRRKKAKRKKRAPLLDPSILDAIYSVMGGHVQRRARPFWLEKFATYEDGERPGTMTRESFRKCLDKMGIQFDTREQYEALADCFTSPNGDNEEREDRDTSAKDTNEMQGVDYTAFVDFACNIRDSRKLREIADSLRQSISLYDGKQPSSSSYNLATKFARIDRHQRGWISSSQFERVFQRQTKTGPLFHLSPTQLQTLVNRFEFEYEKQQLGVDYMQFAQWLQPLLHLNVEKVHARVKGLIEHACRKQGWKVDDVFQAMDEDRNGEIDALELKQALIEMGLPLTDAQIRCLTDEYDVNGDGKVQYNEFVLFFGVSGRSKQSESNKETSRQDRGNTLDHKKKRKDMQTKRNVRNSFSWGITKAFARKQTAKARNRPSASERQGNRHRQDSISSEERENLRLRHGKEQYDSLSEETFDRKDVIKQKKTRNENQLLESSDEEDEDEDEKQQLRLSNPHNRTRLRTRGRARHATPSQRSVALSSTESDRNPSRKGNKQRERRRKCTSKRPTSDDERKNQDSSSSRASNGLSTRWSGANDEEKKVQARRTQHFTSALTARRRQQRAARDGRSNSSSDGRKSVRPRKRCTVSRSRQKRKNYRTTLRRNEIDEAASSSGLDVEQLRRRQRAKRQREREDKRRNEKDQESDEEENEDEDETWSRSDQEYHKHLKHSLRRAFDFFDLNQTSTIDKRELSHVLRALGHEVTSKALDVAMAQADLDRNGALDFYEFVAFVKHQLGQATYCLTPQREMEIRQCFQSLDRDQNGALDEQEFEYLMYKVLQIELAIEEQHALLEFIDQDGDGVISEEEFIEFMKTLEACHRNYGAQDSRRQHKRFLASLDPSSQLAYSAMKKIVRGVPTDIDRSLLMFFGIPSNFRPAISSAATCRTLHGNTMEHVLSFPSPQTIEALALDTRLTDKKESSWFTLTRLDTESEEYRMLQLAENVEAQAIVSLKRAAGVPKPFDTRENDVVKRCVHVCLFQEQEGVSRSTRASRSRRNEAKSTRAGTVVGNVHEVPVYWHEGEEDVWEFSKKATKQDKYKFLVRTNAVNDRLYVLVEFIVHLQLNPDEHQLKQSVQQQDDDEEEEKGGSETRIREMVCCWCKIPVRQLLAKRVTIVRRKEKLWGGTANAPIDIEHDELLRRRTGWRALTNMFTKPSLPLMGIKSVPIDVLADDLQLYVREMPPMVIAPFVALPILAEYMGLMRKTLACVANSSSVMTCEPALKLLPKIVDDDAALSIFRKAFDDEVAGMKPGEDRDLKFQQLVLRMWPSFVQWQEPLPSALLASENVPHTTNQLETLVHGSLDAFHLKNEHDRERATQMRLQLLQTTVSGKLRLQDVRVVSTPFHVREVAFRRLL